MSKVKQETIFIVRLSQAFFLCSTQIQTNDIHWHTKIQFEYGIHCVYVYFFLDLLFNTLICHVNAFVGPLEAYLNRFFFSRPSTRANKFQTFAYISLQFIFHCVSHYSLFLVWCVFVGCVCQNTLEQQNYVNHVDWIYLFFCGKSVFK